MNCKEWHHLCKTNKRLLDFTHYNNIRNIQRSLKYNPDPNATIIHHLRDTEEQRKYNDIYYEYWGFNQDGTFEYGKYVIFVTKEEHLNIHTHSEESKAKMSESQKKRFSNNPITDEQKAAQSKRRREWLSDNDNYTLWLDSLPRGEKHHMYEIGRAHV